MSTQDVIPTGPTVPLHNAGGELPTDHPADTETARRASEAAGCLEAAWAALRQIDPRIPAAVLIPIDIRGRGHKLGHFAGSSWQTSRQTGAHEVAVNPTLFRQAEDLLATLLHEAAHAVLFEHDSENPRHLAGCGPRGYYHRKEFHDQCRKFGLECLFRNKRYGWTNTQWPESGVPERYAAVVSLLRYGMPDGTRRDPLLRHRPRRLPVSGHVRLTCRCLPPRTIYATRAVASEGGIHCRRCGAGFVTGAE